MKLMDSNYYLQKHDALINRMNNILVIDNKDKFVEKETSILFESRHNKFILAEEEYENKEIKKETTEAVMG